MTLSNCGVFRTGILPVGQTRLPGALPPQPDGPNRVGGAPAGAPGAPQSLWQPEAVAPAAATQRRTRDDALS